MPRTTIDHVDELLFHARSRGGAVRKAHVQDAILDEAARVQRACEGHPSERFTTAAENLISELVRRVLAAEEQADEQEREHQETLDHMGG